MQSYVSFPDSVDHPFWLIESLQVSIVSNPKSLQNISLWAILGPMRDTEKADDAFFSLQVAEF